MGLTHAENEYRQARELVADAMKREDPTALEVAASLYRASLASIKAEIKETQTWP